MYVMEMEKLTDSQKGMLVRCKYYNGEEKCPDDVPVFYWEAEHLYVLHDASWPEAEKSFLNAFGSLDVDGVRSDLLPFIYAVYEHMQNYHGREADGAGFSRFLAAYIEGSTSM